MDSKLKAQVIACVSVIVLLVLGTVVLLNQNGRGKAGRSAGANQTVSGQNTETTIVSASGQTQEAVAGVSQTGQYLSPELYEKYELDPSKDPYLFLSDDSFFEPEKEQQDPQKELSLLVSTTQQDIRVAVVDGNGQLAKGLKPSIRVRNLSYAENVDEDADHADQDAEKTDHADQDAEKADKDTSVEDTESTGGAGEDTENIGSAGETTLTDTDGDGMFYLPDIATGQYEVTLADLDGYSVSKEAVPVQVTEEISYTVLEDISFLICSEEEIDPLVDDTAVREAESDADGTETNKRLEDGASVFGIDVSKWNKEIDWKKAKEAGVEFAIIRCGYRGSKTGSLVEDPYFARNMEGATEAGVRVGAYFFTQAVTPVEAVEEASMVIMLCRQYKISYPLFIDTEGAGGNGRADNLSREMRTKVCRAFCETIENAGFTAGVYASKNWLMTNLDREELSSYTTWLAQYSSKPSYDGEYDMWQYTSAGTIDGIGTLVDYNLSYMDY